MDNLEGFSKLLQMSLVPGILISGVGLLLLSITNRLGRTVDRARELAGEVRDYKRVADDRTNEQLQILFQRAEWLRKSVTFICTSIFLSALMMIGLFLLVFFSWPLKAPILIAFLVSLGSVCVSVAYLMADVRMSLKALRLELNRDRKSI